MRPHLLLGLAVCGLWSADSVAQESGENPTADVIVHTCSVGMLPREDLTETDQREELRTYVAALDEVTGSQIDDIESLIPSESVRALRDDHHQWMRDRDTYCWEVGRNSSDDLAELECLAALAGAYYDQREIEISRLEARRHRPVP